MSHNVYIYILVMAGVTYLIRMLPLVLVRKKIENRFLLSFLYYIPYAVLSAMTVPAIFYSTGSIPTAVAGTAAAVVLAFAIWQFGLFRAPSVPVHMEREQPRFTLQQAVDTMHEGFYGGISGWMDNARNSLDQLKDTDFGGKTVRGE